MNFLADPQVEAFAALQIYVKEGLDKHQHQLSQVFVLQDDKDAISLLTFQSGRRWIGVSFFRTPKPLHGPWPPSRFELIYRDEQLINQGDDVTSDPIVFEFTTDFLASGVAKVGDEVIRQLLR